MGTTVRCPYCVLGLEFRPMVAHVDGRYICNRCGHTTRPCDATYDCHCTRCVKLTFPGTMVSRDRVTAAVESKTPAATVWAPRKT